MHIADLDLGILGANGIVGGGLPIATGAALAAELKGTDRVVRLLLRGRRQQRGYLSRVGQPGVGLGAPGGLRLREQPVRHVHEPAARDQRRATWPIGPRPTASRACGLTATTSWRSTTRKEARVHAQKTGPTLLVPRPTGSRATPKSDANKYRTKEEIRAVEAEGPHHALPGAARGGRASSSAKELDQIDAAARTRLRKR